MKQFSVSMTQKEILLDEIYSNEENPAILNLIGFRAYLEEPCSLVNLEKSMNELLRINDSLRLRMDNKKSKMQWIAPYEWETVPVIKLKNVRALEEYQKKWMTDAISLDGGPMYRCLLVECGLNGVALLVKMHHACCDGYTLELLFKQFEKCYKAFQSGEIPVIKAGSYLDFMQSEEEYLASEQYREDCIWWKKKYSEQKRLSIPFGRPSKDGETEAEKLEITNDVYSLLKEFAQNNGCSIPSILMTVAAILVSEVTNKKNFSIYSLSHGRTTFRLKQTTGCMVRTIPVFYQVDDKMTFTEMARNDYKNYLEYLRHGNIPYAKHIRYSYWHSVKNGFNFFHNWLLFSSMGLSAISSSSEIGLDILEKPIQSNLFYCAVYDIPKENLLRMDLLYQKKRFSQESIKKAVCTYDRRLKWLLEHPNEPVKHRMEE